MIRHRLWLDDVRRPLPGFDLWARTAEDAREYMRLHEVEAVSLDHDLGGHDLDPDADETYLFRGDAEDSGLRFAEWMIKHDIVPRTVYIHSWSPVGAENMQRAFDNAAQRGLISNCPVVRRVPYQVPN